MAAILLKNISVGGVRRDLLIENGIIKRIEPEGSCSGWDLAGDLELMDCDGKVAVPGFVNMHAHAAMSLMRGVGEDKGFHDWLAHVWAIEKKLDPEFVYQGARVACVEMIRTGTTTFNDQYWFSPQARRAARELGIRAALGYTLLDGLDPQKAERERALAEEDYALYKDCPLYVLSCHAVYSVSAETLVWASDFVRKHGLRLHIHLSETRKEVEDCKEAHGGLSPVEYLDSLGVLGPEVIAAHCLWLSEHDIQLLGAAGLTCVHNINSNAKLASGYRFLYNELRDAGVNICLGTDGCASSNNLDMLEAMKTAALFEKAWRGNPASLPLPELLALASENGAKALGLNAGRIAEGALADIAIVDTDSTFFLSPAPFEANFVYSAHSDCIDSLICGGRFVMRHREIPGEKRILEEARASLNAIFQDE